jgi:hypothetical protein
VPPIPLFTVIQVVFDIAVHEQPAPVVTLTLALPPAAPTERVIGDTVNEHVPACVTVTDCPATVTTPLRGVVSGLAETVMLTVSLPLRVALPLTVSQLAPLETVHEQPASVVTETVAVPPLTGID